MYKLILYFNLNFVSSLCRPTSNKFPGEPFRPVRAIPFDMFPHTPHCELMVELVRVSKVKEIDDQN